MRVLLGVGPKSRQFSTTHLCNGRSHIGRAPISLPENVAVTQLPGAIKVEGPLGTTTIPSDPFISISHFEEQDQKYVALTVSDEAEKKQRQMWGTLRTLVSNSVTGLSTGFTLPVHLVGVGYRASLEKDPRQSSEWSAERLNLKLGYASQSSAFIRIPKDLKVTVPSPTRIELFCTDKQRIGQFAANVRMLRKPEPYKGKGVFVGNETIRLKSAKKR